MRENGNSFEVQYAYDFVFALHLHSSGIHYIIQRFDATSFSKRNENQTLLNMTEILHGLIVSTVPGLK